MRLHTTSKCVVTVLVDATQVKSMRDLDVYLLKPRVSKLRLLQHILPPANTLSIQFEKSKGAPPPLQRPA